MKNNLRISNIVMTGKLPFKRKLKESETNKLCLKGDYIVINEDNSPIFMKRMPIRKVKELSVHNKEKGVTCFIWTSGAINITGAITIEEGNKGYELVMKDIRKYCKGVLK